MNTLVATCPRCGAQKMNFAIQDAHFIDHDCTTEEYNDAQMEKLAFAEFVSDGGYVNPNDLPKEIADIYEVFCICQNRECNKSTVFVVKAWGNPASDDFGSGAISIGEYISQKHHISHDHPKHLPENIERAFKEGEMCLAMGAINAACTMFRACLDLTARDAFAKITDIEKKKAAKKIEDCGLKKRLDWLFEIREISVDFRDLSEYIKDYGNEGAHEVTLREVHREGVEILMGHTHDFLKAQYTRPEELARLKKKE